MCKQNFLFVLLILLTAISITGWVVVIKKYRENKILLTTFNTYNHYNLAPSPNKNTQIKYRSLILFGDSRIKQWSPNLELDETNIINRGISGETTAQMMLRFKKDVLDQEPNIVVIQAGINDLVAASMANPELKNEIYTQCLNNLKTMVELATKQKIMVILVKVIEPYDLGLMRSVLWGNDLIQLVHNINKDLLTLVITNDTHLLDANTILQKNHQWKPDINRDALHFTTKAYHLLNIEITQLINLNERSL